MSETARPIQPSFNGGEFSRRVQSRVDQAIYGAGLATMENWLPTCEGPAMKRSGLLHVAAAALSATWLSEFRFNLTQSYVQEWSEEAIRFYTNNERIEDPPGTPYEVETPYTAAQAPYVWIQQSFDRQYLAHPSHEPRRLTRTGALTFALDTVPFINGPFADLNQDQTITVTADDVTGVVTLTATSAIFGAGRVGALFRIEAKDFSTLPAWEPGIDGKVANATKCRSDGKAYLAKSNGRTGSLQPTHDSGIEWDGSQAGVDINSKGPYGVQWEYLSDIFGIVRITAVAVDGLSCTATVLRRLPETVTSVATSYWQHGAFSESEGWPSIAFIWQQRLCWIKDFWIYGSTAGDFLNHQDFTANGLLTPDLAFRRRMSISDPALWAVPDRKNVYVGTSTGEYIIEPLNPQEGISGANLNLTEQGNRGSANVKPVKIGGEVVFAERGGLKIRSAEYAFDRDRYPSKNLTQLARHITGTGVVQMFWHQNPEQLLGVVRTDGQIAMHAHDPELEIRGWSRMVLAAEGKALSAISTPSPSGSQDDLWALVERDGVLTVERQMPLWDEDRADRQDAFFVDSGVFYTGAATDTISAPHLAGRTVRILAAGYVVPDMEVAGDGTIGPIPAAATPIVAGLGFSATMKSLRFEQRDRYGQTSQGLKKRITRLILRLLDTGQLAVQAGREQYDLISRRASDPMDQPIPLFSDDTDGKSVGGDWDRDGEFYLVSDNALPAMVAAVLPTVEVGGG